MTFKTKQTIRAAKTGGFFVDGVWQDGVPGGEFSIMASVQPAKRSDYDTMEQRSDGARVERMVRLYTVSDLKVTGNDGGNTADGDVLLYRGREYLIRDKSEWQSNVISHFRYLAVAI